MSMNGHGVYLYSYLFITLRKDLEYSSYMFSLYLFLKFCRVLSMRICACIHVFVHTIINRICFHYIFELVIVGT